MILLPRPEPVDGATLHAQVNALLFGGYSIEWLESELCFRFDRELTDSEIIELSSVVAAHDGTEAIRKREEEAAKIAAIQASNRALVESAREKRLSGQSLTQAELAALVDAVLFPGG